MTGATKTCATCRYWQQTDMGMLSVMNLVGECSRIAGEHRRGAKAVMWSCGEGGDLSYTGRFVTEASFGCTEHQPGATPKATFPVESGIRGVQST